MAESKQKTQKLIRSKISGTYDTQKATRLSDEVIQEINQEINKEMIRVKQETSKIEEKSAHDTSKVILNS